MYVEKCIKYIIFKHVLHILYVPDFLASRQKPIDFENYTTPELASTLREFYCCVHKLANKDGVCEEYGRASYLNIRSGLQRFLVGPQTTANLT